ncbi:MAG: rRNA pseudouridine synthase [Spirochaetaceae bacterium]|nr:rRNA pseudouridine synthase [Spirochaetaceae bacterium]
MHVYLARAGVASRRSAEGLILAGRVSVNGRTVSVLGEKVSPEDDVRLDGVRVQLENRLWHLALNKPAGYLCSSADPQGRALALDLLPADIRERLYTVGRLDYRSCGLILCTNDGGFAAKAGHPSARIEKEYLLETSGIIPDEVPQSFLQGLDIEGERYRAERIRRIGRKSLCIVLIEGKNREIRRVCSHFHLHPVILRRIRIGPVLLGGLKEGESRPLARSELSFFV